jgi:hypothetical protein
MSRKQGRHDAVANDYDIEGFRNARSGWCELAVGGGGFENHIVRLSMTKTRLVRAGMTGAVNGGRSFLF